MGCVVIKWLAAVARIRARANTVSLCSPPSQISDLSSLPQSCPALEELYARSNALPLGALRSLAGASGRVARAPPRPASGRATLRAPPQAAAS